uniref:Uncharacterized protein n=1 Tax=Arundo donax TaxID=35708 RepID=A0A0A8YI22_ARUDO
MPCILWTKTSYCNNRRTNASTIILLMVRVKIIMFSQLHWKRTLMERRKTCKQRGGGKRGGAI